MQYRRRIPTLFALLMTASLIATGCSKCEKKKKEKDTTDMAESVDMAEEDKFDPAGTQLEFRNLFDRMVKECTFNEFNKPDCKGEELAKVQMDYFKMVEEHGVVILPVLSMGLAGKTDPPRRLAAYTLHEKGEQMIEKAAKTPDTLDSAEVTNLLAPLIDRNAVDLVPRHAIGAAVMAATLKEMDDEALGLIRSYDPTNKGEMWVHAEGVEHLMVYGRMRTFEFVKEAAKKEYIPVQLAAFQAAWNMPAWTEEESSAICEWAGEYYQADDDIKWKALPAKLLVRCKDRKKWDGELLSEAKRRIEKGIYSRPFADAIRDLCKERRVLAFLQASERAVAEMGTDGRVVLVGEAVLAGDAPDATDELRVRIARQLGQGGGQ